MQQILSLGIWEREGEEAPQTMAAVLRRPPLALRQRLLEPRDSGHVLSEKSLPVERELDPSGDAIFADAEVAVLTHRLPVGGSVLVLPAGRDLATFMTDGIEHGDLSPDHVAGAGPLWLTAAVLERSCHGHSLIDRVDAMLESVQLSAESVDAFRGSQTQSPDLISDDVAETRRLLGDGFETANHRVVDVPEERETPAGEEYAGSHAHRSEAHSRGSRYDPGPQVSVIELGFHLQIRLPSSSGLRCRP